MEQLQSNQPESNEGQRSPGACKGGHVNEEDLANRLKDNGG